MKISTLLKVVSLSTVAAAGISSTSASAQLLSPIKITIGNGAPLLGGPTSKIGISLLTPKPNGTPVSIRLLGTDKAAGVYIKGKNMAEPIFIKASTPLDTKLQGLAGK
jgi:hypothetical protein